MTTRKALPKPRNPFVRHLITKKQGAHGQSKKAVRRDDKAELKRSLLTKLQECLNKP